jgi:hypothetical protein
MMKQRLRYCFSWTFLLLVPILIGTGCGWMGTEPTLQEAVLYEDNFVDPTSGWPNELVYDNYYIGYMNQSSTTSKSVRPMIVWRLFCRSGASMTLSVRLRCS